MSGWPEKTWDSLKFAGIDDWSKSKPMMSRASPGLTSWSSVGFSLWPLNETQTYNTDSGPAKVTDDLDAHQIHIVMDGGYVNDGVNLIKTNPPKYLELYNEPDYSFQGVTPVTDPVTSAKQLAPFFAMPHPDTTYISPALADATSAGLDKLHSACNGC